jgi:hypothetical protein
MSRSSCSYHPAFVGPALRGTPHLPTEHSSISFRSSRASFANLLIEEKGVLYMGLRMVLKDRLGQYPVGLNVNNRVTVLEARVSASHQRACPMNSTSLEPA